MLKTLLRMKRVQVRVSSEINRILEEAAALSVKRGQFFVGVDAVFEVLYQKFEEMLQGVPADIKRGLQWVLQELDRERWRGVPPSNVQDVFFTTRCCNVINEAARIATQLSGASPNGKHLLLAILSDPLAAPSRAMDVLQLNRKQLIETLRESLYRTKLGATRTKEDVAARTTMDMPPNETAVESTKDTDDYGLQRLTRDLTALARAGKLEPAIGRSGEITQLLEILGRKTKNNAILVGDAGVGKTRIVEGLALALASGSTGRFLENARIVELNIGLLTAGTEFRGAFEKRVAQLLEEIERIPNLILFIDEVHLIMGAGSTEGSPVDLANLLKPALARGNLRCIGATTLEEYRKFIERDPAIERRFQMVRVEELSPATTLEVLEHLRPSLERHHGVRISRRALKSAVELTQRYMPERRFPDKAIDVLDQACARHRLRLAALAARNPQQSPTETSTTLEEKITPHDIRKVVSRLTSVPIEEIADGERQRLENLEHILKKRVVGQDEAVRRVAQTVRRARTGLASPDRPSGVFLFLGPSGVGKTLLAKVLAEVVFGSSRHLYTFDMSEYIEEHSVARLLGAPPGYVGSDQEGRLSVAVRHSPFSVLLFDEIDKAHPRVFDILLPILDEGRIKDARGRDCNFRNCILIFTSNIAAKHLRRDAPDQHEAILPALKEVFRPEFINRIDEFVPFFPLLFEDIRTILSISLRKLHARLQEKGMNLRVYQGAYEYLARQGYSEEFGARELQRTVDRLVINPISEQLIRGDFVYGDTIEVLMVDDELTIRKAATNETVKELTG